MDWTRAQWLTGETQIEEARRRERAGEGRVIEDGLGGAVEWIPVKQDGGDNGQ